MNFKNIEIKGLRGFRDKSCFDLAVPDGKIGSGLTLIVGPNNSGKSTIVEAFCAISNATFTKNVRGPSFTEEMRNKSDDNISIKILDVLGNKLEIVTDPTLKSETRVSSVLVKKSDENIYVLRSRRTFNPYYEGDPNAITSRDLYIDSMKLPIQRESNMQNFFTRVSMIEKRKGNFDNVMKKVLDPLPKWEIDRNGLGHYYMKFIYDDITHISDGLGDGLLSIFFIIDALYDSGENGMVVIDEPELSLHPTLQKKLSKLFAEYSKDRQIIISTHSPYFVDWTAITNGAKIIRVVKESSGTKVYQMSSESAKEIESLLSDLNNPHILGLNANEVFFLDDKVILVEGQEDLIFYKRISEELDLKLNGDFYGWGVGGSGKMKIIARILCELGFKKVVGILDKGKEKDREDLTQNFPEYGFFCIPADYVRTKKARKEKEQVIGLVDEKGMLRAKYKETVESLFHQINSKLS